ncbi:MAG: 4-hydroxy-tetrahydrodipicolinate reductase [Bacteroidetes bacterium]|nr:4-hydroxy-tetrahydrodipicolinate reductase [Bacteroidota bacterium]
MKIALIGYGKMGKAIEQVILDQQRGDEIIIIGRKDLTVENLRRADVAIEFTEPDAAIGNISLCLDAGVPVVVGTTAWLDKLPEVTSEVKARNGSLFYAPNFSIGVNIFFEINRRLAAIMQQQPQYEVAIEEIHHTEKKDAPSGTAIRAAEVILAELSRKKGWALAGAEPAAAAAPLLITAKREPHVPGTHIVTYSSIVDEIQLIHQAHTRRGFAEGAVMAARWLVGRKGVFEMKDMLAF